MSAVLTVPHGQDYPEALRSPQKASQGLPDASVATLPRIHGTARTAHTPLSAILCHLERIGKPNSPPSPSRPQNGSQNVTHEPSLSQPRKHTTLKATTYGVWDFTETEWAAIDKAVRNVYYSTRDALAAYWQAPGNSDPAAELRSWAYEWAATHAAEIHDRAHTPAFITKRVRERLQERVVEHMMARPELPHGGSSDFEDRVKASKAAARLPRPTPPKAWRGTAPHEADPVLDSLTRYGHMIPTDQIQFIIKGHRKGKPMYETPEAMAKLHTRKPTRREFWEEVCTEPQRKRFRRELAATFNLGICNCTNCEEFVKNAISPK